MNRHRGLRRTPFRTRPRNTGPSEEVRQLVFARDGWQCVLCEPGKSLGKLEVHHRTNRGAGGSSDPAINLPSNLLSVCAWHNGEMERRDVKAAEANGWKVRHTVTPPSEIAVVYPDHRRYVLDDVGGRVLLSH